MSFTVLFVGGPKDFAEFCKTDKFAKFCEEFGISSIHSEEIPAGTYYPRQTYAFLDKLEEEAEKTDKVIFIVSVDLVTLSTWRAKPEGEWTQPVFIQTPNGVMKLQEIMPNDFFLYSLDDIYYHNIHKGEDKK